MSKKWLKKNNSKSRKKDINTQDEKTPIFTTIFGMIMLIGLFMMFDGDGAATSISGLAIIFIFLFLF